MINNVSLVNEVVRIGMIKKFKKSRFGRFLIFLSHVSAGFFIFFITMLIVLLSTAALSKETELVNQVALLSVLFAILPTMSQILDMIWKEKEEFTITGKCPRC